MSIFEKPVLSLVYRFNWISSFLIVVMMLLTCADVVLRFFRHPIPGTYEIVGLLGALVISFSLAYTSEKKGHIAVEFLVKRLPARLQNLINAFNLAIATVLFSLITKESFLYAGELKSAGEVSLTLHMPIYPYIYGVALGCGLFSLLLVKNTITGMRRLF